jgi:APA family basic amino acid/polyamine antiporter
MNHLELRRGLGLWAAASIVVGTVIGSGIFITPKAMVLNVGSPSMVFAVFVFGGLLSLLGALTYAELAAAMPEAGGEYVYLREAYGPFWGFVYGWTQVWVAKSGSIATLATGLFAYAANFAPGLESPCLTVPLPIGPGWAPLDIRYGQVLSIAVIAVLGIFHFLGVKAGGQLQVALTVLKVALMGGIVGLAFFIGNGTTANIASSVPVEKGAFAGFFAALVAALWAYDGWNNVSMVASEVERPSRNLPRALILGTLAVVFIYLLMNAAYFWILNAAEVASGDRVAVTMMRKVLGPVGGNAVSIAVMISIFAALNGSILSGARVPFAMARDGLFFSAIGRIDEERRSPGAAILLLTAWSALLVLSGRYEELYTYVVFASWILYAMAAASVFVLRRKRPDMTRPYRTLGYPLVPALFVGVAAVLLLSTAIDSPRESLLGFVLIASGVPFFKKWDRQRKNEARSISPD